MCAIPKSKPGSIALNPRRIHPFRNVPDQVTRAPSALAPV
jgi:hypothetical protein